MMIMTLVLFMRHPGTRSSHAAFFPHINDSLLQPVPVFCPARPTDVNKLTHYSVLRGPRAEPTQTPPLLASDWWKQDFTQPGWAGTRSANKIL